MHRSAASVSECCPFGSLTDFSKLQLRGKCFEHRPQCYHRAGPREPQDDAHGQGGGIIGYASVALRPNIVQAETWSILVRQDPNEAYAPLRLLVWKLVAFGMLVFAVVALLRWRLGRRIVQPINTLVKRVQLLGQQSGEKPMMATQSVGIVELDTLAASFDELAERLEHASRERGQYVAELERANQELAISEEHYRMLWDHSTDTRLLVNEEGIIQDVNRRGEIKLVAPADHLIVPDCADC